MGGRSVGGRRAVSAVRSLALAPAADLPGTTPPKRRSTLRAVPRLPGSRFAALVAVLGLTLTACTSAPSTSRGELGSQPAEATPEPSVSIEEISAPPDVVIAPTPTPEGPRPFRVATLMGETGVLAPLDGPAIAGVVSEIDRINEQGGLLGRPIELQRIDTNSRAGLTERLGERLVEDPPDLIVTSCDTELARPMLEMADANGLLTISPCASDVRYLTGGLGPGNFTLGAPSDPQGEVVAAAAFAQYGLTAIVLLDVTSPEAGEFCAGFERAFRALGGTITHRDEFSYDTLEPVQDRLEDEPAPAFVTVCSHVPGQEIGTLDGAPAIISMVRSVGINAPIVGGSTLDEPGWFGDVPTLGELLFVSWSSNFGNDPDARVNDVVRAVQQNGETPGAGVSTILGAETIEAWARAVEAAGSDETDRVIAALGAFADQQFATGAVSFTGGARMDLGRSFRLLRVVGGELTVSDVVETDD